MLCCVVGENTNHPNKIAINTSQCQTLHHIFTVAMLDQSVHVLIRFKTGVNLVSIRFETVVQFSFE